MAEASTKPVNPQVSGARGTIEIDLLGLFYRLIEKIGYIIAAACVGVVIAGVYGFFIATPMYEATSQLYVLNPQDSAINLSDLQLGTYLAEDYQAVFETWEVQEMVLQNLDLPYTREKLQGMLSVTNRSETRILYITVTSPDPQEAADIANEFASVAGKYISDMMLTEEPSMLSKALPPERPVSPRKKLAVFLGGLLGGLLMGLIVTVQFLADDKIKTAEDIRRYTGKSTLALIPANYGKGSEKMRRDERKDERKRRANKQKGRAC